MLVSPAEPKQLRDIGLTSSVPERFGVDFLFNSPMCGSVGVQRKEVSDFVASAYDGRLVKELAQMKPLGLAVLLIEGRIQWTNDGNLLHSRAKWTRAQHLGSLWSIRLQGYWIDSTDSMPETIAWLSSFVKWTSKDRHTGLKSRPGPSVNSVWGKADSRDWAIHLLQGFPGIGAETAGSMYDHFGGVPLTWTVDEKDLLQVKGVGRGRAKQLVESLPPTVMQDEWVELDAHS